MPHTPTVYDFRRENLRNYISANGGPTVVARKLEYSNASFIVQMTGPAPIRLVSESTARQYEKRLSLPAMSLDTPVEIPEGSAEAANSSITAAAASTTIRKGRPPSNAAQQVDNLSPAATDKFAATLDMVYHAARQNNINIDPKFMFLMRQALLVQKAEQRQPEVEDLQPILDLLKTS